MIDNAPDTQATYSPSPRELYATQIPEIITKDLNSKKESEEVFVDIYACVYVRTADYMHSSIAGSTAEYANVSKENTKETISLLCTTLIQR